LIDAILGLLAPWALFKH
jgi:hypothetical protein